MLDFTDLQISERDLLEPYLVADGSIQSDRCFSSIYIWSEHYKLKKCIKDNFLFFLSLSIKRINLFFILKTIHFSILH